MTEAGQRTSRSLSATEPGDLEDNIYCETDFITYVMHLTYNLPPSSIFCPMQRRQKCVFLVVVLIIAVVSPELSSFPFPLSNTITSTCGRPRFFILRSSRWMFNILWVQPFQRCQIHIIRQGLINNFQIVVPCICTLFLPPY